MRLVDTWLDGTRARPPCGGRGAAEPLADGDAGDREDP